MPAHPIDFTIQAAIYSTPELVAIFDEKKRFQRWLTIEAALAQTQAEFGIIPEKAAREITEKADISNLDLDAVARDYLNSRNSIMPLIKELRAACSDNHGEFVHYGATTQDILDTSQILELREIIGILSRDLSKLSAILIALTDQHKNTPMIGRTHGQQGLPITFGFKTAIWLQEIKRHIERLVSLAPELFRGQLSGAVGTMAALGPKAREVAKETMLKLELGVARIPWHTSRDNIAAFSSFCAMLAGTLEKIASEIINLGKTEIGELREPAPAKAVSSSTMPHKRNPVISQRICVLARHVRAQNTVVIESMVHDHERDGRALWSEWLAIPQICVYTGTALHYINEIMSAVEVDTEKMKTNLYLHREMVVSEYFLFRMGEYIGKMKAQEKLQEFMPLVLSGKKSLKECISNDKEIGHLLDADDLALFDAPEKYTGHATAIAAEVVEECRKAELTAQNFFEKFKI